MDDMKQQLSALMDDELDLGANPHLLLAATRNDDMVKCWADYHLIGDALRHEALQVSVASRVMQRLASEPTVLAPRLQFKTMLRHRYAAAVAVAFVGWMVWNGEPVTTAASVAQNSAGHQNALSSEAFDSYLLAHAEYAPNNGLQRAHDVQLVAYTESGN